MQSTALKPQPVPLILRVAIERDWEHACRVAIELTRRHVKSPEAILIIGELDDRRNTTWLWKRETADAMAKLLAEAGMSNLAALWETLAADPARADTCTGPHEKMRTAYTRWHFSGGADELPTAARQIRTAIEGWGRLAEGGDVLFADPFREALNMRLPDEPEAEPEEDPEGPSLLVVAAAGGNEGGTGKDARAEFAKVIGRRMPLRETPDLAKARATLAGEFPHCTAAIDAILGGLRGPIHWRPTLLVGSYGCGKSRLAARLPVVLGLGDPVRFDGASASDASFGGTPRRWSTGEPCFPLDAVRRTGIANCCLFIDEVDKAGSGKTPNGNFANSLLGFIEPETARAYSDPFLQAPCDLSMVNYILTANDERDLPAMLRDRLRLLRIPEPKAEHLPQLARTLAKEICAERGLDGWPSDLDDFELDVAERLWPGGSIRRLRSIVEIIISKRDELAMRH